MTTANALLSRILPAAINSGILSTSRFASRRTYRTLLMNAVWKILHGITLN